MRRWATGVALYLRIPHLIGTVVRRASGLGDRKAGSLVDFAGWRPISAFFWQMWGFLSGTANSLQLECFRALGTLSFPPIPSAALHHLHLLSAAIFSEHSYCP